MFSAIWGICRRAFLTSLRVVCVDGGEGLEADSRESGATGSSLGASCISRGVALHRVEGPGAPNSLSYVVN